MRTPTNQFGTDVDFEAQIVRRHRQIRIGLARYLLGSRPLLVITAPVVNCICAPRHSGLTLPGDLSLAYFPIYGIPQVRRRDYLLFDREYLAYLNAIERLNCLYCSYAGGLIGYVREITSRTEQYWCPIKHARRVISAHGRYPKFSDYGDAENYHRDLSQLRKELQDELKQASDSTRSSP